MASVLALVSAWEQELQLQPLTRLGSPGLQMVNATSPLVDLLLTLAQGSRPAESQSGADMPGSFPGGEENPYKTSHIDPRVDSKPSSPALSAAKTSTRDTQPSPTAPAEQPDQSHKGRNAGIGAAVLGAVGLGGHESRKHHEEKEEAPAAPKDQTSPPTAADSQTSSFKPSSTPDETRQANVPESEAKTVSTGEKPSEEPSGDKKDHHYGRDAGILGAAAAAIGLGSREARKEKDQKEPGIESGDSKPVDTGASPITQPPTTSKESGQGRADLAGPAGLEEQRYDPSGISKQNITPVGTFDRSQKDTVPTEPLPEQSTTKKDDHHYGRDAGLTTAAGAAGVGAYETKKHHDDQPAPRSHPPPSAPNTEEPNQVKSQNFGPTEDKSHYPRDAGLAGGAAAAGVGSYEAGKHLGGDNTSQKEESPLSAGAPPDQISLPRHNRDTSKSTFDDATTSLLNRSPGGEKSTATPTSRDPQVAPAQDRTASGAKPSNYPQQPISREEPVAPLQQKEDDHTTRNAALGAAGLGAGAYGAKKLHDQHEPSQAATGDHPPGSPTDNWPLKQDSMTYGAGAPQPQATAPHQNTRDDQTQPPEKEDHTKRNAALAGAGATGAGAAAYAGHEYSQHEAEKLEKERLKEEKAQEKELAKQQAQEQKEADKAAAKEAKQHEKEAAKEEKKAEKEAAKAEKKHEKEVAKEEKKHEKEVAAAEKKHEKEIAAAEKEREKEAKEAEKRHEKEVAAASAAAAAEQREREKERERLEKEAREKEAREKEAREAEEKEKEKEKLQEREKEEQKYHGKETAAVAGTGAAAAAGIYEASTHDDEKDKQAPDSPSQKSISSQGQGDGEGSGGDKKERHGLRKVLHKIAHPTEKDHDDDHYHEHRQDDAAAVPPTPDSPPSSGHHGEGRHKLHKDPPASVVREQQQYQQEHGQGAGQEQEPSEVMDKEAHYLAERFADTDIEERIHRSLGAGGKE